MERHLTIIYKFIPLFVTLFLFSACSFNKYPASNSKETFNKKVVIFIPGFKGTVLKDKVSNKDIWITEKNAFFNLHSLAVKLDQIDLKDTTLELIPTEVLVNVPVLGGLLSYDTYGNTFESLTDIYKDYTFLTFPYDWRQDLSKSAKQLSKDIDALKDNGATHITLISHSMGGLIVAYYLRYGDQDLVSAKENWQGLDKVDSVVFSGTPFRGVMTIFNDMQIGIQTLLNTSLLSNEALSTFSSSYQLLPYYKDTFSLDPSNNLLPDYMFNTDIWIRYKLGLFKNKSISDKQLFDKDFIARKDFTKQSLKNTKLFFDKINDPILEKPSRTIPILNLIGRGYDTISHVRFDPLELNLTFTNELDGDQVVATYSAKLPQAYQSASDSKEIVFKATHGQVISDEKAINAIEEFSKYSFR